MDWPYRRILGQLVLATALMSVHQGASAGPTDLAPDPKSCGSCHENVGLSGHQARKTGGCGACHVDSETGTRPLADGSDSLALHLILIPTVDQTCTSCHEPNDKPYVHPEVEESHCLTCHAPHDEGEPEHLRGRLDNDVCGKCHEPDDHRYRHTILARGECTSCHTLHGSTERGLLLEGELGEICATCHETNAADKAVPHDPAVKGDCISCHDAHGSDEANLLVLPPKKVCTQCHKARPERPEDHSAFALGRCSGCHEPHGSESPLLLRGSPVSEVCFRCHDDDVSGRNFVHAPVKAGHCEMCHEPHNSHYPDALRVPANLTCAMCHFEQWRPDALWPHQAVIADGCPACHDPHGSTHDLGLRKPVIELCTSCHPNYDDGLHAVRTVKGSGHPMGEGVIDTQRDNQILTCVSCHDPHGSDNPSMFYRGYKRMAVCVECHRKTLARGTKPGQSQYELDGEATRQEDIERRELQNKDGGS